MKTLWKVLLPLAVVGGLGTVLYTGFRAPEKKGPSGTRKYEFTQVVRGAIEKSISTTGTLEPVSQVKVLAQMSGRVESVLVDYNQRVQRGQVLASINTDMLRLQKMQAEAAVKKAQANYDLQKINVDNETKLWEKKLISDYDLNTAKTNAEVAAADLASAQASLRVIDTEINDYALIKSPITGIILDKNIEVGQNVVEGSSSNSTTLFTLAEDLSHMEIQAEVDELDIPAVKVGQTVRFTIAAKSGANYEGVVKEIHLIPETTNSIVNYYVIISAPNRDGSLLPGMTATITFIEDTKKDALLVPNGALRFIPSTLSAAEIAKKKYIASLGTLSEAQRKAAEDTYDRELSNQTSKSTASSNRKSATGLTALVMGGGPGGPGSFGGPRPGENRTSGTTGAPGTASANSKEASDALTQKTLWYLDDQGEIQCILVHAGITDGIRTEVSGPPALEGLQIILKEKAE
jgi:HlyD family secretion protein